MTPGSSATLHPNLAQGPIGVGRARLHQLVGQHQGDHGLHHGHGAGDHAGVVPPARDQVCVLAVAAHLRTGQHQA